MEQRCSRDDKDADESCARQGVPGAEKTLTGAGRSSLRVALTGRQGSVLRSSVWQLLNTLVPYVLLWGLMILTLRISYVLTLALAMIASGFLVRIFIILHDCAHGSFLKSQRVNSVVGFVMGVLCFTPFARWRHDHVLHHATAGDLDRRGTGDIWTMTVQEYESAPRLRRLGYRVFRSPLVLFVLGPVYVFLIEYRVPSSNDSARERKAVHQTNVALLAVAVVMTQLIGLKGYLLIQVPILMFSSMAGMWLFYVQHQFEDAYWERGDDWSFELAALRGSSYYRLPAWLQWFSGNIGFHHIHHLSPAIPNYRLAACHADLAVFEDVPTLTLRSSLKSASLKLWDEANKRLVPFPRG